MPKTILDKILVDKRDEVRLKKQFLPISILKEHLAQQKPLDFAGALRGNDLKLIAEVKKASPSRGVLSPDFNPIALASAYVQGGASAISVLTDVNHFQGSLRYLAELRDRVGIPLLRKDFIIDEYQVYESAVYGADALLLIAAILSPAKLRKLLALSHSLGLTCLVEIHNEYELETALGTDAEIIGINNRDLNTFKVDIDTTRRLRPLIPEGKIVVSESGITSRDDVKKLKQWGVNAVLIGEALVTAPDIPARMKELMS